MPAFESDLTFWLLAFVFATVSLLRLAARRRQQLIEILRNYVQQKQSAPSGDDPPA